MKSEYKASSRDEYIKIINVYDLENAASRVIPHGAFEYIAGGAGDELTLKENITSFNKKYIIPRVLQGIEEPDTSTSIFDINIKFPIIMAPAAAHGLAHETAEKGTAKGIAEVGTIMSLSTYSTSTIEEVASAGNGAPQWFQLYMSKDDNFNKYIVETAEKNGAKAIIITADATVGGNREADIRNNFTFPLEMGNLKQLGSGKGQTIEQIFKNALQKISRDSLKKVRNYTDLPIIVKGIQSPVDAIDAISVGADAIWISNHGGRQLDGGPASFDVLEEISSVINKKVPVIFDSGIRRGQHIFKAIASGADIVAIGRPAIYGLALGGYKGVKSVFEYFNNELQMVMQLAGSQNISDIKKTKLK